MIMKYIAIIISLSIFLFPPAVQAAEDASVTGLWLTKKRDAAVQVTPCGDELCGHIAWLHEDENPFSITGKPLCRAQVLSGFKPADNADNKNNVWKSGTVYKVDDEKTYRGTLTMLDDNTVELRAYLGIPALGKTKTLTRTSAKDYPPCSLPTKSYAQTLQDITPAAGNE